MINLTETSVSIGFFISPLLEAAPELRGRLKEVRQRKVIVEVTLSANGSLCARAVVTCVRVPENMEPS